MSSCRSGTEVLKRTVRCRGGGGRGGKSVEDGLRRRGGCEPGEGVGWRGVSIPGRDGGIGEVARLLLILRDWPQGDGPLGLSIEAWVAAG